MAGHSDGIFDLQDEVSELRAELAAANVRIGRLLEVMHWSQAVLTALNSGDVFRGSRLHLKLREVLIAYREGDDVPARKLGVSEGAEGAEDDVG
jgi:hypothetical protein